MQSACIQYPNFYGFVLWNLNVYKKLHSFFLLYNKFKKNTETSILPLIYILEMYGGNARHHKEYSCSF